MSLIVCVCVQAAGGRHTGDGPESGGQLRSSRSSPDPTRHHHHAPLRRGRQRGLAHPAQEPITAGPVGGEWAEPHRHTVKVLEK